MNTYDAITLILIGFFCFALLFLLRDIANSLVSMTLHLMRIRLWLDIYQENRPANPHRPVHVKLDTQDLEKLSRRP